MSGVLVVLASFWLYPMVGLLARHHHIDFFRNCQSLGQDIWKSLPRRNSWGVGRSISTGETWRKSRPVGQQRHRWSYRTGISRLHGFGSWSLVWTMEKKWDRHLKSGQGKLILPCFDGCVNEKIQLKRRRPTASSSTKLKKKKQCWQYRITVDLWFRCMITLSLETDHRHSSC